ncbi:MAG TPA: AAA family ATPase [Verrucomicrobiae bacterium]
MAKRCREIRAPFDIEKMRAAIWFLQKLSWQPDHWQAGAFEISKISRAKFQKRISPDELERFCLDPHFFSDEILESVLAYRAEWIAARPATVQTEISRRVMDALEYAQRNRCLVLVDGLARIGKTFAARAWCERSAGLVRLVQTPASNDDQSFFRAIAKALGVSASLKLKAVELRARVEETLAGSGLMLVLDESHYCFPSNWQRYALPSRVNWIMTALVNEGVPVTLITTPQFLQAQARCEKLTGWTSEQFLGRIGHLEKLPDRLERKDLLAVAGALLPDSDAKTLGAVAAYAELSQKHLASIESIATRAAWLAQKDRREIVTSGDVAKAVHESLRSDPALARELNKAPTMKPSSAGNRRGSRARPALATRLADSDGNAERFSRLDVQPDVERFGFAKT